MRTSLRVLSVTAVLGAGYVLGSLNLFAPNTVSAQPAGTKTDAIEAKIKKAHEDLKTLQKELVNAGRYQPVVTGVNSFAVTVGGVNAVKDLEEGRGVDPETFAGIYAEQFQPNLASSFKKDRDGRWTYKNKVVRMYSEKRIKELIANRLRIAGVAGAKAKVSP